MRKMFRTLVFGVVLATPLLLAPHQSQAGIIQDILTALFGKNDNKQGQNNNNQGGNNCSPGTSVPLNEGQVLLIIAGLGLGAKMLYNRRKLATKSVII
ncbi:MAG: hypothetical protein J0H74_30925 [Chitinophagaceae bacterium]|nr:hypothetical protein [Chitinophagaceae bacterium]